MTRYQVQAEEFDCSLTDQGSAYANKAAAVRVARHLAKCERENNGKARNFLVFDNRAELFVFTAKVGVC